MYFGAPKPHSSAEVFVESYRVHRHSESSWMPYASPRFAPGAWSGCQAAVEDKAFEAEGATIYENQEQVILNSDAILQMNILEYLT